MGRASARTSEHTPYFEMSALARVSRRCSALWAISRAFGAEEDISGPLGGCSAEMIPVRDQDLLSVRRVHQRVMKFQFGSARLAGVTDNLFDKVPGAR